MREAALRVVTMSSKYLDTLGLGWRALSSGTGHGSEPHRGGARVETPQLIMIVTAEQ
jgi:hypothetical protein